MLESTLSSAFTDILCDFASYMADLAAEQTLAHFRNLDSVENKLGDGAYDPVTEADRGAEAAIRQMIEKAYPDHEIEGEEYGLKETGSDFRWVLDPVDGTRAFIAGLPTWGTLIAIVYQGSPIIGVIDQPYLRERYIGTTKTATLNHQPITTRKVSGLGQAHLSTTDPGLFADPTELAQFQAVRDKAQLVRYGMDCYAYARLAAGGFDIVMESGLKTHDRMALIPVIRGAGGAALDWSGNEAGPSDQLLALANPDLKDDILAVLEGAKNIA